MIGFPLSHEQVLALRRIIESGGRLSRGDARQLLDGYEALVFRVSAADAGLHGIAEGSYFGDAVAEQIERERSR